MSDDGLANAVVIVIIVGIIILLIWGSINDEKELNENKSKLGEKGSKIRELENELIKELNDLSGWVNNCRKCNHNGFYIHEIDNTKLIYKCSNCSGRKTLNYDNTFYKINSIPKIRDLFDRILGLLYSGSFPSKYGAYLNHKASPTWASSPDKIVYEFMNTLKFNYIIFNQSKNQVKWNDSISSITFTSEGSEMDRVSEELKTKKVGKLSPNRKPLNNKIIKDWNYKKITTGKKGLLIKEWSKKSHLECIDGSKCGGVKFSSLDNSEITFGHIIPQSWGKEYPHMIETIHHPDNLYLTCKSCNSSLNSDFPDTELKKKISGKEGTIGDWLRTHIKEIEPNE